jgi:molybdopterin-guanine dinucleotide biosynthesis protein
MKKTNKRVNIIKDRNKKKEFAKRSKDAARRKKAAVKRGVSIKRVKELLQTKYKEMLAKVYDERTSGNTA